MGGQSAPWRIWMPISGKSIALKNRSESDRGGPIGHSGCCEPCGHLHQFTEIEG